jgi:hypothetical protein
VILPRIVCLKWKNSYTNENACIYFDTILKAPISNVMLYGPEIFAETIKNDIDIIIYEGSAFKGIMGSNKAGMNEEWLTLPEIEVLYANN